MLFLLDFTNLDLNITFTTPGYGLLNRIDIKLKDLVEMLKIRKRKVRVHGRREMLNNNNWL